MPARDNSVKTQGSAAEALPGIGGALAGFGEGPAGIGKALPGTAESLRGMAMELHRHGGDPAAHARLRPVPRKPFPALGSTWSGLAKAITIPARGCPALARYYPPS